MLVLLALLPLTNAEHRHGPTHFPHKSSSNSRADVNPHQSSLTSCLSRIRLAATFDPKIASEISRAVDSLRIDRLRSFVCEKAAYFCKTDEQHMIGGVFNDYNDTIKIIERGQPDMVLSRAMSVFQPHDLLTLQASVTTGGTR
ncbi:unnamed protein product [Caenorhabditis auriculariae]|uniref:Uncharacterized protein n=1 Tax=Caenorhabditis auriculariae TaxID=2777116 RepID=A0A8S1HL89_9PELO|nr:unnamed protein product [Caenorhabditis auriculariae]